MRPFVLLAALAGCRDPVDVARAGLGATDLATRLSAAYTLAEAGPAAAVAVRELAAATADPDLPVGDAAVWALAEIGPAAAAALPTLLSLPVDGQPLRQ
ncbi:MAG TPA: hypothetical protein VFT55_04135, partial [Planctomycetota bacterium]|nr:hypothetical protein [Planctomycetota bacterium]